MADQFILLDSSDTAAHTMDDSGNATHTGTVTAATVAATSTLTAEGADVRGGLLTPATISGGSAGDHTVTGIATADELIAVIEFASGVPTDRTAEFSITAANTINNTGGTDTTGDTLFVLYMDASE